MIRYYMHFGALYEEQESICAVLNFHMHREPMKVVTWRLIHKPLSLSFNKATRIDEMDSWLMDHKLSATWLWKKKRAPPYAGTGRKGDVFHRFSLSFFNVGKSINDKCMLRCGAPLDGVTSPNPPGVSSSFDPRYVPCYLPGWSDVCGRNPGYVACAWSARLNGDDTIDSNVTNC